MTSPRRTRSLFRPGVLGAVLLVATLVLAGALGVAATRSAESHRAAVERTLDDYAAIAAWQFARQGRLWLGFGMNQAGADIDRAVPAAGPLPGPTLIHRVLAQKECDCMSAGFARTVFLATFDGKPTLVAEGQPLGDATRAALLALLAGDSVAGQGPRRWRMLPPGEPGLAEPTDMVLAWKVFDERGGRMTLRGSYGMIVEVAQIQRPLQGAVGDTEFLPPSLIRGARTDSVVRLAVASPGKPPILETAPPAPAYAGTDTLGTQYGGLTVRAEIRPAAAGLLIAGGLPSSRKGPLLTLLVLTIAIGAAALLLLRREQQLARLRDDFVSGVSHELRTPLTQIRMLSELLQGDGFKTAEERSRAVSVIHREALRLSNLVDNVLQFARLRRRPAPTAAEPVAPGEVVDEVVEAFQPLLASTGTRVEATGPRPTPVVGDRESIARILRNLLENAIKYGPAGQTVRIGVVPHGATVRLTVEDEGPGIPAADRPRVWQPYQRLERDRNASVGGSGLGLSVVAELVAGLGGRAWIEDAPGRGARFVVELPAAEARG